MNYKIVFLNKWVKPFYVPQYISRIDIDKDFNHGTHGWQVRYFDTKSKFFSDSKNGVIRTPYDSLEEATDYLKKLYVGNKPCSRDPEPKIIRFERRGNRSESIYLTIADPSRKSLLKVYIGTDNTYSEERHKKALEKILIMREERVTNHNKLMKEKHTGIKS